MDLFLIVALVFLVGFSTFMVLLWWVRFYNEFQTKRQTVFEYLSNIGVIQQMRVDNLISIVRNLKQYDDHENDTMISTIASRQFNPNSSVESQTTQISALQDGIVKVQALIEAYPILKADALHSKVMERNNMLEGQLQDIRRFYNSQVRAYNTSCKTFPRSVVARVYHFDVLRYLSWEHQEQFNPRTVYE